MPVIYKLTNQINGKSYIGQTSNLKKRMCHYRSYPFLSESKDYNQPIHKAIRENGIENFTVEIIEELSEDVSQDFRDERESFYIKEYKTLISEFGYNVSTGGVKGGRRVSKTFEEILDYSRIFSREEILDIQEKLQKEIPLSDIYQAYPKLTQTFLSNINTGYNFRNPSLNYPLREKRYLAPEVEERRRKIKELLKEGVSYKEISLKFDISISSLSNINNGKACKNEDETYPLSKRT